MLLNSICPLYGGGYVCAVLQIAVIYYGISALLHFVLPRLHHVESVQQGKRRENQIAQEVKNSVGEYEKSHYKVLIRRCFQREPQKLCEDVVSS